MRIELFENFETENYYQEISIEEWWERKSISMSESTINKILKILPVHFESIHKDNINYLKHYHEDPDDYPVPSYTKIFIYESDDEYFYVFYNKVYETQNNKGVIKHDDIITKQYKCDQLSGLEKLIKTLV